MSLPRLVLVGGGHAHLEVLRRLEKEPLQFDLTLISSTSVHLYSGMIPGYLSGIYEKEDLSFNLEKLARRAGGQFIEARVEAIDSDTKQLMLEGQEPFEYDLVSFNVGSRTKGGNRSDVQEHAYPLKPFFRLFDLRDQLKRLHSSARPISISVVGAGAAGYEIACSAASYFRGSDRATVRLLEASATILSGYSREFQRKARTVLATLAIDCLTNSPVERIGASEVVLKGDRKFRSELTVWSTGPRAPSLFASSGLPLDEEGFLLVNNSLQSVGDDSVFGAGDCITMQDHRDLPKAGVYAVRQAPALHEILKSRAARQKLPTYEPQSGFLSLLNTSDGKALLRYKSLVSHSRWAWWLKDWIDRRFVRRYESK